MSHLGRDFLGKYAVKSSFFFFCTILVLIECESAIFMKIIAVYSKYYLENIYPNIKSLTFIKTKGCKTWEYETNTGKTFGMSNLFPNSFCKAVWTLRTNKKD